MNLAVTVGAALVEGEHVKSRYGLVPPHHVHVARLAKNGGTGLKKVQVIGTMRHVASVAVLPGRCVLPKKGAAFFGVAGVAQLGSRTGPEHGLSFTAVRIMTGDTGDFRIAMFGGEQVGGPLQGRLSFVLMTTKAQFLIWHFQKFSSDFG